MRREADGWQRSPDLEALVDRLVSSGRVCAAVAVVGSGERIELEASAGLARQGSQRGSLTGHLFDLASLTKPCMATLALRLDQEGLLPLDLAIGDAWPGAAEPLRRRTLEDLLRHRAGFQPWTPLYRRCRRVENVSQLLLGGALLGSPAGTYSDLGYVLWGLTAERMLEQPLERLFESHLTRVLGAPGLKAPPGPAPEVVACRLNNARERELAARQGIAVALRPGPALGAPQDGNARLLGGLGGHAGLFGSAPSLWKLARAWLRPGQLLGAGRVAAALQGPGRCLLGWSRRRVRGDAGPALSPLSYGHTGFTGGSLWIDPVADRILILLAHRMVVDADLAPWRRRFHRLALPS